MNIVNKNFIEEIKNIVLKKAKYQKVMLIYDENVSVASIVEVYEEIKNLCIFNKMSANECDTCEVYNGYRVLIFMCSVNSYLKLDFNKGEFVNIFIPTSCELLPYFLNKNNTIESENNFLFIRDNFVDINLIISIFFNKFFNYFKYLFEYKLNNIQFDFSVTEITSQNTIKMIEKLPKEVEFKDIEILKNVELSYQDLQVVDLLLIDALLLLIKRIKNKSYMLIDVYKIAKKDMSAVDKFYSMATNQPFLDLINLNYNCLFSTCKKTKEKILELCNFEIDYNYIDEIINKIKNFAKNDNGIIGYLYLYNIFDI